jgi:hypothetical protein
MLDLGSNDFSVASGGTVCVPVTASAADVIHTDTALDDGTLDRQYVFNDIPVGTGKAVPEAPEDDSVRICHLGSSFVLISLKQGKSCQGNLVEGLNLEHISSPLRIYP